jgi:D-amino peptidase
MKIYISADIEGTAGISHWDEANKSHFSYPEMRELMTGEVLAACEGAIAAGATEIFIKDAHDTGRNIISERLPREARLIRAWSGHPFSMVQGIDESFAGVLFTGYHSKAGSEGNPLAHTMSLSVDELRLNGEAASEFHLHALAAGSIGVPALFLSGDKGIAADAKRLNPGMVTTPVSEGIGPSTISLSPRAARAAIKAGIETAIKGDRAACVMKPAPKYVLEVKYTNPVDAYRASWYPGAKHSAAQTVMLEAKDYFDIMRALRFIL